MQKKIERFYIFSRDTLIDNKQKLINPEFLIPFIELIDREPSFAWAISCEGAGEYDPAYKAICAQSKISKLPSYVQFNQVDSFLDAIESVEGAVIEWTAKERTLKPKEQARIVLRLLLENRDSPNKTAIPSKKSRLTLTEDLSLKFQFGETILGFNAEKFLKFLGQKEDGYIKFFNIIMALDQAGLTLDFTDELNRRLGVQEMAAPADHVVILPKNVIFVDDHKCPVIRNAGFMTILADTPTGADLRNSRTTNTYMNVLQDTLPQEIKGAFLISKNIKSPKLKNHLNGSSADVGFQSTPVTMSDIDDEAVREPSKPSKFRSFFCCCCSPKQPKPDDKTALVKAATQSFSDL